jgi:hypothetical protein
VSDVLRTTDTGTRTGLPFLYPYEYKGTGADTLTGNLSARQLDAIARSATGLAGLEGYRRPSRATPQPERRETPARAVAREEAPEPARAPAPHPVPEAAKPERCRKCRYLTTAVGHKVACGDGAP